MFFTDHILRTFGFTHEMHSSLFKAAAWLIIRVIVVPLAGPAFAQEVPDVEVISQFNMPPSSPSLEVRLVKGADGNGTVLSGCSG